MTPEAFQKKWESNKRKLLAFVGRPAHTIMGNTAVSWFRDNYRKEQWFNGSGWQRWKKPKRFNPNGSVSEVYGTLLSKRQHLVRNIQKEVGERYSKIVNRVPYAKIHNEGGDIEQNITITPKMRRWAWYMYYKTNGIKKGRKRQKITENPLSTKYKALALTKKQTIHRRIHMPKRPFIYANAELAKVLRERLKGDIRRILMS